MTLRAGSTRPTRGGKDRVRVWCTQFASCRWAGYRRAHGATRRPCPRCGRQVAR